MNVRKLGERYMYRKLFYCAVLLTVALLFVGCAKEKYVESVAEPTNTTLAVYPYTTNNCVYVNTSTGIEQYAKNGTKVGCLKLKNAEILFVDKNWLYYSISDGSADGVEIYRIPVYAEGGEDIITYGREEKILTESDGIATDGVYVKGAYLVYITNYHEYKKYNLESSEFKKVKKKKANCTWGNEDNFNDSFSEEAAYLLYDEKGIYRQNFKDDSLSLVERELPVCSLTVTPRGVFYIVGEGGEEQIKVYDEEQNKSTVFIDTKQMKQAILSVRSTLQEETAKDMFYLDSLFISGNRLFIEAVLYGENDSNEEAKSVIFSCSMDDASDLGLEKNLINCMKKLSTVSNQYDFDIQKVIDGNILFTFYNEMESEKLGYYNLEGGATEEIRTGETKEWLLQYYNSQSGIDLSN